MVRKISGCVTCGAYCDSSVYCSLRETYEYSCDSCGDEVSPECLYRYDGQELCEHCLLEQFETVG